MLVDNGLGKRLLTSPSLLAFIPLLAVAPAAGRSLIGSGPPAAAPWCRPGAALDPWGTWLQSFHPDGTPSAAAPPWLAVLATLATVLAGKTWLAVDVILIGCVPLAGMTAMHAARKVTTLGAGRVWASVTYALLPVATGVIASGRFGTAVAFILLPLILAQAGRLVTGSGPQAPGPPGRPPLRRDRRGVRPAVWLITPAACPLAAAGSAPPGAAAAQPGHRGVHRARAAAAVVADAALPAGQPAARGWPAAAGNAGRRSAPQP
jgi:hypothetical protein